MVQVLYVRRNIRFRADELVCAVLNEIVSQSIEAIADKKRKWSNIRKCLDMEWEYHDEKKLWFILY